MEELFKEALKIKLLEKQKFEELYSLANNMHFEGKQEDIEIYYKYIDNRQDIIDEIDSFNSEYHQIKELLETTVSQYNEILSIEKDIKAIINKIIEIDDKNNTVFKILKDSLSQEMSKSFERSNVSKKYYSTAESISSMFFDKTK